MTDAFTSYTKDDGRICCCLKHYMPNSYFDTVEEMNEAYKPILDWLDENVSNVYDVSPFDNAAYSDHNEDPWVGYYITFDNKEDAVAFKLIWDDNKAQDTRQSFLTSEMPEDIIQELENAIHGEIQDDEDFRDGYEAGTKFHMDGDHTAQDDDRYNENEAFTNGFIQAGEDS